MTDFFYYRMNCSFKSSFHGASTIIPWYYKAVTYRLIVYLLHKQFTVCSYYFLGNWDTAYRELTRENNTLHSVLVETLILHHRLVINKRHILTMTLGINRSDRRPVSPHPVRSERRNCLESSSHPSGSLTTLLGVRDKKKK